LVKKLFKLAEAAGDDEAMGHFMAAFDRLHSRDLVKRRARRAPTEGAVTVLRADAAVPRHPHEADREGRFTHATRRYLRRRAFRYFRALGRRDPVRYRRALTAVLLH
jgi:hypothetical protein